jgi:hypothetical protein
VTFRDIDVEPEHIRILMALVLGHEAVFVVVDGGHKLDGCFELNDLHAVE